VSLVTPGSSGSCGRGSGRAAQGRRSCLFYGFLGGAAFVGERIDGAFGVLPGGIALGGCICDPALGGLFALQGSFQLSGQVGDLPLEITDLFLGLFRVGLRDGLEAFGGIDGFPGRRR
jgi:hypothetical protein